MVFYCSWYNTNRSEEKCDKRKNREEEGTNTERLLEGIDTSNVTGTLRERELTSQLEHTK